MPKLRVDVVVTNQAAEPVAEAIASAVKTGTVGNGKIWICPVEAATRSQDRRARPRRRLSRSGRDGDPRPAWLA